MALVTVDEVQVAMGANFTDAEAGKCEYLIQGLSDYIQRMTRVTYETVTGAVERFRADPYGRIEFFQLPVTAVTQLFDYQTQLVIDPNYYIFDGIREIRGLYGWQVVDVTYSYGLAPTASIKWAASEAVKRGMLASGVSANLKSKQVGDVIYEYVGMFPLTPDEIAIFNQDAVTEWTIRLDPSGSPAYDRDPSYPFDLTRYGGP